MPAQHVTQNDFEEKVLKAEKPVIVEFYAEWCGPCRMAGPIFDKLADEFADKVLIAKVNVDEAQDLAQKYNVMSIPTVIVFKDGKEIEKQTGFAGEEGYRKMIKNHFKS